MPRPSTQRRPWTQRHISKMGTRAGRPSTPNYGQLSPHNRRKEGREGRQDREREGGKEEWMAGQWKGGREERRGRSRGREREKERGKERRRKKERERRKEKLLNTKQVDSRREIDRLMKT